LRLAYSALRHTVELERRRQDDDDVDPDTWAAEIHVLRIMMSAAGLMMRASGEQSDRCPPEAQLSGLIRAARPETRLVPSERILSTRRPYSAAALEEGTPPAGD
jgi:hypothetical protein